AVTRMLTVRVLLGRFDPASQVPAAYTSLQMTDALLKKNDQLALESARQSLVLLKNEADFLPLDMGRVNKIALIGPLADVCHLGGYS
ncbi:glycoside hydrolase family 3 C-terminal domain-containing protein, partial [Escherichia coli]|uniref:glycoside hydrolase family 3 C-terminal domain-containing protein n=1 Tax=Escherichia coli TaxID=562 RepID=UPI001933AB3C